MAVLKDIDIDGALCDNMVDMNPLFLTVAATSGYGLCQGGIIVVLGLCEERRDEDDVVCYGEVSGED